MKTINGKSAIHALQLRDRREKGFETIEVHLFEEQPDSLDEIEDMLKKIRHSKLIPRVLHVPIQGKFSVETFHKEEELPVMTYVLNLAKRISEEFNQKTLIVLHQELRLQSLKDFRMLEGIEKTFKKWLDDYPDVEFALENLSILSLENGLRARDSYLEGPVELAEHLRSVLQTERIGSVLDTCHMISSIRVLERIGLMTTMEYYFQLYSKTLKLIHLSNARIFGFKMGHGTDFVTEEEIQVFERIVKNIHKYCPEVQVTIETNEPDVLHATRMLSVKNLLEKHR